MKKIYLLVAMAAITGATSAQRVATISKTLDLTKAGSSTSERAAAPDTLDLHFAGATPTVYSNTDGGYMVGHNSYEDKAKMMKFDATYGVPVSGKIHSVLVWFGHKEGDPASTVSVRIYSDNNGKPGTVLGSTLVTYADIDTSAAALQATENGAFNTVATFATPINIPSNQTFWAGVAFTYKAGDTIAIVSSRDPEFPDAVTHTFEQWSDNTFHSFNDGTTSSWQSDIALAIFPVVEFVTGLNSIEKTLTLSNVYPSPATKDISFNYNLNTTSSVRFELYDITGKMIFSQNKENVEAGSHKQTIDVSTFAAGTYLYSVSTDATSKKGKLVVIK